jgi:hypothetical protein
MGRRYSHLHGRHNKNNPEVFETNLAAGKVDESTSMEVLSVPYGATIPISTWQAKLQEQSRSF